MNKKLLIPMAIFTLILFTCKNDEESSTTTLSNECKTNIASNAPDWVKNNFTCVDVSVDGDDLVISTRGVPNYNSYYFGSNSPHYEAMPSGRNGNPNKISELSVTMRVPLNPTPAGSPPDTLMGIAGISANGVAIFNNAAAPGDSLANEAVTFDSGDGHPNNTGVYHYHTEPVKISSNDGKIIGIALDGFPIYGAKETDGSTPGDSTPALVAETHAHEHTNADFGTAKFHYHLSNDTTAGIVTILGDKYVGAKGTISQ